MLLLPPGGGGGGDVYTGCDGGAVVCGGFVVVVDGLVVFAQVIVNCWVPVIPPADAVTVAEPAVAGAVYRAVSVPLAAVPDAGVTWPAVALRVTAAFVAGALPAPTRTSNDMEPPQLIEL